MVHINLPRRHPGGFQGQTQATATSTQALIENIATVPAIPHAPIASQPLGPFSMAQQPPPARPSGPRQPTHGIPGYSSQIEGLSVSQDVVNDALLDLQTKVLNETLQQYHDEGLRDIHLSTECSLSKELAVVKMVIHFFRSSATYIHSSTATNPGTSIGHQPITCRAQSTCAPTR